MTILAQFDGYILRDVEEKDRAELEAWIEADRFHDGVFEPEFFLGVIRGDGGELAPDPRASCYALEDAEGTVFFIRLSRAARVHMQFGKSKSQHDRKRTAQALMRGMAFLEVGLARAGAQEWIFDTEDSKLAEMARAHMGFKDSLNELVREIEPVQGSAAKPGGKAVQ